MTTLGIPNMDSALESDITASLIKVETLLSSHIKGKYPLVIATSRHLVEAGGKRLRPLLTLLASYFGNPHADGIIEAAVVSELTHLATLYHDDVMDEAPLRRGVESANNRWGNTVAILTGDYLFAKVSALLADLGPEAVKIHALTFERLVIGQILETQGPRENEDALNFYLRVVADKTGSLIATSAQYGAMFSGAPRDVIETLTQFGEKIGIVFQLADDVIDIESESTESGKTPGTDLKEGIPTLVTLRVLQSEDPADVELKKLLQGPIESGAEVQKVITQLRSHKALTESKKYLDNLTEEAKSLLSDLPNIPARDALVNLCDAIVARTS